ncbi:hypothetical protein Tco_0278081 [Tanacetum coccineum]
MAALLYKDDHNKLAYLGRESRCEDFTNILSYLDHSPLRYALTHDPPVVFDSLVKQFWATATVRPNAAGSHDLVAAIDGREGSAIRGQHVSGADVVVVDKLPDDEIVDPRVKVEPTSESPSSPPRSRSKHRGVRSDTSLWDRPIDDFLSSESESDDDIEEYIPPIPYGAFKDWEIVRCPLRNTYYHVYYQVNRRHRNFFYLKELLPHVYREDLLLLRRRMNRYFRLNPDVDVGLDLWRDVNLLCQSLHSDDVEEFWRTQDEWVVSGWRLYPKSSVHVLDLTNGKTVYMFVDKFYPIRISCVIIILLVMFSFPAGRVIRNLLLIVIHIREFW